MNLRGVRGFVGSFDMKLGDAPFLATQVRGDTAWVDVLYVPPEMRRRGVGRAVFDRWAQSVPAEVQQFRLLAVNIDGEFSTGFWRKLGFEIDDDGLSEPEIATCYMVRSAFMSVAGDQRCPASGVRGQADLPGNRREGRVNDLDLQGSIATNLSTAVV